MTAGPARPAAASGRVASVAAEDALIGARDVFDQRDGGVAASAPCIIRRPWTKRADFLPM